MSLRRRWRQCLYTYVYVIFVNNIQSVIDPVVACAKQARDQRIGRRDLLCTQSSSSIQ